MKACERRNFETGKRMKYKINVPTPLNCIDFALNAVFTYKSIIAYTWDLYLNITDLNPNSVGGGVENTTTL